LGFRNGDRYSRNCGPNEKYEEATILTRASIE